MEKYQMINKKLGAGSFGNVEKAQNIQTKQIVAIKKLKKKYGTWEECLQLSQVKALRKLNHENIIKLKEVVRVVNEAFFVFEYIERDLFKLITQRKQNGSKLQDSEIRHLTKQIVEALQYTHKNGFFHRDLKPENVLISNQQIVKIIDFGIAKEIRSKPPFTQYISTRWYRAPQILLKFTSYSVPVDVFALGCLVAQMYLMRPLFMGNSQIDQISKICSVLGSPTSQNWPQGIKQAAMKGVNFPQFTEIGLSNVIPDCPNDALDFIGECLKWDPSKRISTSQMLLHPFLTKQFSNLDTNKLEDISKRQKNSKYQDIKVPENNSFSYKGLDLDDQFQELLNNYSKPSEKSQTGTNIGSGKKIEEQKKSLSKEKVEDDDEWF